MKYLTLLGVIYSIFYVSNGTNKVAHIDNLRFKDEEIYRDSRENILSNSNNDTEDYLYIAKEPSRKNKLHFALQILNIAGLCTTVIGILLNLLVTAENNHSILSLFTISYLITGMTIITKSLRGKFCTKKRYLVTNIIYLIFLLLLTEVIIFSIFIPNAIFLGFTGDSYMYNRTFLIVMSSCLLLSSICHLVMLVI